MAPIPVDAPVISTAGLLFIVVLLFGRNRLPD
jgi:hypothetical protein